MRRLLIASVLSVVAIAGVMVGVLAMPATAQAHWSHTHRFWHHAWYRGTSYYPYYAFADEWQYWPICVWHRSWDAYWYRACS
jgi:hypothetical protein